jgi:hypothetical protein
MEAGMPSTREAIAILDAELLAAKRSGVSVLRIIHGWGSSGVGGILRDACRSHLKRLCAAGRIRGYLAGDDYSKTTNAGRDLIHRCNELLASERSDSRNPGITFVEP